MKNRQELIDALCRVTPADKDSFPFSHSIFIEEGYHDGRLYEGRNEWVTSQGTRNKWPRAATEKEIRENMDSIVGNHILDDTYPYINLEEKKFSLWNCESRGYGHEQALMGIILLEELGIPFRRLDYTEREEQDELEKLYYKMQRKLE
jgi:hypothetical protein